MAGKDDGLGLSLSLKCSEIHPPNLSPPVQPSPVTTPLNLFRSPLPFISFSDRNVEPRPMFRGIDMNRAITIIDVVDEEVNVSSPNSMVSSLSGKRSEREETDGDSLDMDEDGGEAATRKKLRLSKEQGVVLEEAFKAHNTLNPKQKMALAKQLNLRPRQVEVWFQNRRARTKLKQTEVDCEYLRRCYENLTDENGRLQKEVNDLRALKMSPQFYMNMSTPTTLTRCPQCERISSSSGPSASTIAPTSSGFNHKGPQHHRPMTMASWATIIPPPPQPFDDKKPRS